jgi:hypothetical protein
MCDGSGFSGSPTVTQSQLGQNSAQTNNYSPYGLPIFQNVWERANAASQQPYQPYGGQLVAGVTPIQDDALHRIGAASGVAAPYVEAGTNFFGDAGRAIEEGEIARYLDPYRRNVIDATMANINETNARQQQGIMGNATAQNALGGDRARVAQAALTHQQNLTNNQTLANLQSSNWEQALRTALANRTNANAAGQGMVGAGLGYQRAQQDAGQGLWTAAGQARQVGQDQLTAAYQQFQQQQAFPYQQAQFLSGIALPAAGAMGGTQSATGNINQLSNATTTPPGMSWLQAILGGGALAGGIFSGLNRDSGGGGGDTLNGADRAATGGRARLPYPRAIRFADGGSVDEDSWSAPRERRSVEDDDPWEVQPINYMGTSRLAIPDTRPQMITLPGFGTISMPQTGTSGSNTSNTNSMSSLGTLIGRGADFLFSLFEQGGAVKPYPRLRRYAEGGDTFEDRWWPQANTFEERWEPAEKLIPRVPLPYPRPNLPQTESVPLPRPDPRGARAEAPDGWDATPVAMPTGAVASPMHDRTPTPRVIGPYSAARRAVAQRLDPANMSEADIMDQRRIQQSLMQRPRLGQMARDPDFWVRAGLNTLAADPSRGGIAAAAKGATGAIEGVEARFKEDMTAAQKAQVLAANLKEHSDKYKKMTPYQSESLKIGRWVVAGQKPDGTPVQMDTRSGELRDAPYQFTPARTAGAGPRPTSLEQNAKYLVSLGIAANEAAAVQELRKSVSDPIQRARLLLTATKAIQDTEGLPGEAARQKAIQILSAQGAGPSGGAAPAAPGSSLETAIPYVKGETKRKKGLHYKLQDGTVRPYQGADE